ncbi:MAG: enoyl-CoA hydratase/isomerase family protein [Deltaproteobacteria bacterium]|nr:enoyl-CoA hydratase/isomerase family protein [Deltaproteobacteria bacterium]
MSYENIRFEVEGAVATLTFDRPKALNALNPDTLREVLRCLRDARRQSVLRAIVLTGAGDKAFVAGADIAAMSTMSVLEAREMARLGQRVTTAIEDLPMPVIAAVNGFALGGGLEMVMACDLVIASERARFGQPEINLGIIPGFGGTQRLARRVGAPRAREMIYGGEMIDAETAYRWGLVNRVVKPGDLLGEARRLAATLAAKPAVALAQAKHAIQRGLDVDLENGLRLEAEAFAVTFSTDDRREGMEAFLGKRPARFTGR